MEGSGRPSVFQAAVLVAGTGLTAFLYSVYRHHAHVARGLQGARRLRLDRELRDVLLEAPGHCVPYVAIEGVVNSVKDTLSSQFVDDCKGVVQRLTLQEHKIVWNRTTHLWNNYEKIIHQRTNTTAFNLAPLEGGTDIAVQVMKPLMATELSLETVHKKFHSSVQSFPNVIGHYISGERPKGIQETEQMLKVGATLTGVGELVLDNDAIKLQPPKQGLHYYLSSANFDTLLKRQETCAKLWKLLTVLFGCATCAFLFFLLRKQYLHRRERRRFKRMQEEFRQARERLIREVKAKGGEKLKNICVTCLSSNKSCAFLECGHVCSCSECYRALPEPKRCPICRQLISRVVPLYYI
ncbi:mitochondrial ubiquitin ligase activator of NFKB 1-like [Cyrtonyx montezumae]|uniref:mitochondrial ubiquitin ligase activator of NFKB 1-like n=1 Tax=Cyrtonyx montezumae TaxID=9017 RepID=UPI0032D9E1A7